jgi:hypothetical protein
VKDLIIRPRRSGKTSWLKREYKSFLVAGHNCYMVTRNANDSSGECCILPVDYINGTYEENDIFFIDEYFFLPNRDEFTHALINRNHNFIAVGTPDCLYDAENIELIKLWRKTRDLDKNSYITKTETFVASKFGSKNVYNLLSYPYVNVVPWVNKLLATEEYETEILGKIYKTD